MHTIKYYAAIKNILYFVATDKTGEYYVNKETEVRGRKTNIRGPQVCGTQRN